MDYSVFFLQSLFFVSMFLIFWCSCNKSLWVKNAQSCPKEAPVQHFTCQNLQRNYLEIAYLHYAQKRLGGLEKKLSPHGEASPAKTGWAYVCMHRSVTQSYFRKHYNYLSGFHSTPSATAIQEERCTCCYYGHSPSSRLESAGCSLQCAVILWPVSLYCERSAIWLGFRGKEITSELVRFFFFTFSP